MMYVLYFVIAMHGGNSSPTTLTSLSQNHNSQVTCEAAKNDLRQNLSEGKVILARCVPK